MSTEQSSSRLLGITAADVVRNRHAALTNAASYAIDLTGALHDAHVLGFPLDAEIAAARAILERLAELAKENKAA